MRQGLIIHGVYCLVGEMGLKQIIPKIIVWLQVRCMLQRRGSGHSAWVFMMGTWLSWGWGASPSEGERDEPKQGPPRAGSLVRASETRAGWWHTTRLRGWNSEASLPRVLFKYPLLGGNQREGKAKADFRDADSQEPYGKYQWIKNSNSDVP